MKNLDDASDELLMVDDEDEPVPFQVADVFFHTPLEETKVTRLKSQVWAAGLGLTGEDKPVPFQVADGYIRNSSS